MAKGIFLTGTGTDIGKTYIAGLLVRTLAEAGKRPAYYKAAMHEQLPQLEYICSGERPLTVHELCALIGEYLGKKTRFVSLSMNTPGPPIWPPVLRGRRSTWRW